MASAIARFLLLASLCTGCRGQIIEGQAAVFKSARDVLDNKHGKLKIPWKFEEKKDEGFVGGTKRDIGYVGDLPLNPETVPAIHLLSLETAREVENGIMPVIGVGSLKMPNLQPAAPPPEYRADGRVDAEEVKHLNGVTSPTAELTTWQYQRNRLQGMDTWLANLEMRFYEKLVVIFADAVTLYGGCTENILEYKYTQIINAANGSKTIVMAAEVSPYPEDLGWKYSMEPWTEERREGVLDFFGVARDWATAHADCPNTTNNRCTGPPTVKYANGGLMMGPVWAIRQMLKELRTYTGPENRYFNEYFLRHPDIVTLDYAGTLFFSLTNMATGALAFIADGFSALPIEIRNGTFEYSIDGGTRTGTRKTFHIYNKVTGGDVCFVHGDGRGFPTLELLAEQLVAYQEEQPTYAPSTAPTSAPTSEDYSARRMSAYLKR